MNDKERLLLSEWLDDESFLNWANQKNNQDILIWENYFNKYPEHWALGKLAKQIVQGIPFREVPDDQIKAKKALSNLLNQLEERKNPVVKILNTSRNHWLRPWKIAASIAFLAILCSVFYIRNFYNPEIQLATKFGEQLEQKLPDGTKVVLNANSKLRYWVRNPRKVWLQGEAFFEVVEKPITKEPFQVITTDLSVNVLGTSFNVNTRNDQTEVFLEEGKVALQIDEQSEEVLEMVPGDLVAYSKKQDKVNKRRSNVSSLERASWKEGALIFKDTPLSEALFSIEDIYGVQFVLASEQLRNELISGGVPIRNLEVTLQTLRQVYGIQITTKGKRYFLRKGGE